MERVRTTIGWFMAVAAPWLAAGGVAASEQPVAAEQARYFELHVRPVLVEHCVKCHGPEKQKSGFRIDSHAALMKGGESGPAIVPGNPDGSPMIQFIRYTGETQMPPKEKLPDEAIKALEEWVKMGAPWPNPGTDKPDSSTTPSDAADGPTMPDLASFRATHWSLQPIGNPAPPAVQHLRWGKTAIDRFLFARLKAEGLLPNRPADKRTLIRRATIDLTGLPPTPEEVDAFLADDSPDAFAKLIDRLLASPRYGERWGRHWLDIARYSDTRGYALAGVEPRFPYAYTYRDYVIDAFNADKPYDRFILEQIAADKLDLGDDKKPLAALGFITVGRRFLNNQDTIDDRIDVVTRGLMAITVTCARCHDHKFDPVPAADYYSLHGVFASSDEPNELPLIGDPQAGPEYDKFQADLAAKRKVVEDYQAEVHRNIQKELREKASVYLVYVSRAEGNHKEKDRPPLNTENGEIRRRGVERWAGYVMDAKRAEDPVFAPWHAFNGLPGDGFAEKAKQYVETLKADVAAGSSKVNRRVTEALAAASPTTMAQIGEVYGKLLEAVDQQWREHRKAHSDAERLPDDADEQLRQVLYGEGSPAVLSQDDARSLANRAERQRARDLQKEVEQLQVRSPGAPPRAMALADRDKPVEPYVFLRGQPERRGPSVPRRFVAMVAGEQRATFTEGSGRLELAYAIVAPDNPLTARVLVNIVWMHHFGTPIVNTPHDFGAQGDKPTHPELLDHLARTFIDGGWSIKQLHRTIMLTEAYQQTSDPNTAAMRTDPENRLYWRYNRRRVSFESLRDSMLAVAGRLDTTMGGRPVDIFREPFSTRRSVYAFIDRQDVPGTLRAFDFANPDITTAQRTRTTVPQQALFMLNSPFVIEQAAHLAQRPELAKLPDDAANVTALYRIVFGRPPTDAELKAAIDYVHAEANADSTVSPWQKLAQALLCSNEFAFVD